MAGIKERITYANVMASIAVFIALGAGAYAAGLGKDSVKAKQIKAGAVKTDELANDAVTSPKVANGSLRTEDFAVGQLPSGAQGPQGTPGSQGATGPRGATGIQGVAGRSALSSLQSGESVTGAWATQGSEPQQRTGVTLPIPAPTPIDSLHAAYQTGGNAPEDPVVAGCTGSVANPVSAPGYACIYASTAGVQSGQGYGVNCSCASNVATGDGTRFGFVIVTNSAVAQSANGSWTYTAP
jgi:hypothetical protein